MIEVRAWFYVLLIAGCIIAGIVIEYQDIKIKKLKKKLKETEKPKE